VSPRRDDRRKGRDAGRRGKKSAPSRAAGADRARRPRTSRSRARGARPTFYHYDCVHFRGDKPCGVEERCEGCGSYAPVGRRILIIKLGARGDVLRTTPVLRALKARDPRCHVTWVVDPPSVDLLSGNPLIDRLLPFVWERLVPLLVEEFDLLLSLDKEPRGTGLASLVRARERRGFGLGPDGAPRPLSPESQYAYDLGIDDHLKFVVNERTYQEIVFEIAGLAFRGEPYLFTPTAGERRDAMEALRSAGLGAGERAVGLNTGGGLAFANKGWTVGGFARLAERVERETGRRVILLGGEEEAEKNAAIARATGASVLLTRLLPVRGFAALLEEMDAVVTGDTLALHLAIALQRPIVLLFGSTAPQEIALYGLGEKVLPRIACAPCYLRECPVTESCMDSIEVDEVMGALRRVLATRGGTPSGR
jgi:ADP-heptose:LPS heptosyltransferase